MGESLFFFRSRKQVNDLSEQDDPLLLVHPGLYPGLYCLFANPFLIDFQCICKSSSLCYIVFLLLRGYEKIISDFIHLKY